MSKQYMPFRPGILAAAISLALCIPTFWHQEVRAEQGSAEIQTFDLPAAPLAETLNAIAARSDRLISVAPSLTRGLQAPAVRGDLTAEQAVRQALAGSGLVLRVTASGVLTLERAPAADVQALEAVTVRGASDAATEGSGSYAVAGVSRTATRLPMTLRETPQSISVVTRQRIEDEGLNSVEAVLNQTPGISIENVGASRYTIYSRGYAIDNFQLDGIVTAMDIVSQNIPQSQSDMAIYDRVEVLRGAAGLMTGAGDPSGTLNLVRKKPTHEFQGHVAVSGGTWDRYRAELDLSGPLAANGRLRGRVVGAHEEGNTHIDYYSQNKTVLYGLLEADVTDSTLVTLGVDYQHTNPRGQSSTGLPLFYNDGSQTDFDASDNAAARWNRNEMRVYNTFLSVEQQLPADWTFKVSANHLEGTRKFSGGDASWGFPDRHTGDGVRLYGGLGRAVQRQTGIDLQFQGPFELWGRRHDAVLGFNWSEYENDHEPMSDDMEGRDVNLYHWHNDTPSSVVDGKLMDYDGWQKQRGAYAALRLRPRDDLAVIVGARVSRYDYQLSQIYASPALARFNKVTRMHESGVVTPYAGIVYDLDDTHSVYASYTSIFKPQSQRDSSGAVLDPRKGDNFEIGLKSEFLEGRLNSAIALYQIRQDNLAELDPGQTVPGTSPVEAAYRAVKGAKTTGLDMELAGEVLPGWQLGLSYNYALSRNADGEQIRTIFPRHMAKLWTTYRLPGDLNRLTLGGGVNWQSRIHYSATTWDLPGVVLQGQQSAYTVVNLMARYDFSHQLSATLNINNVFDRKYLQGLDQTFHTGLYAPTRNAMLTLRYQF